MQVAIAPRETETRPQKKPFESKREGNDKSEYIKTKRSILFDAVSHKVFFLHSIERISIENNPILKIVCQMLMVLQMKMQLMKLNDQSSLPLTIKVG